MQKPCTVQHWLRCFISVLRMGILVGAKMHIGQHLIDRKYETDYSTIQSINIVMCLDFANEITSREVTPFPADLTCLQAITVGDPETPAPESFRALKSCSCRFPFLSTEHQFLTMQPT